MSPQTTKILKAADIYQSIKVLQAVQLKILSIVLQSDDVSTYNVVEMNNYVKAFKTLAADVLIALDNAGFPGNPLPDLALTDMLPFQDAIHQF